MKNMRFNNEPQSEVFYVVDKIMVPFNFTDYSMKVNVSPIYYVD